MSKALSRAHCKGSWHREAVLGGDNPTQASASFQ